jgi:hypothetical protein
VGGWVAGEPRCTVEVQSSLFTDWEDR